MKIPNFIIAVPSRLIKKRYIATKSVHYYVIAGYWARKHMDNDRSTYSPADGSDHAAYFSLGR